MSEAPARERTGAAAERGHASKTDDEPSLSKRIAQGRPVTGSGFARAQEIVDEVLERAARRGERNTAWVRLAFAGSSAIVWPWVARDAMAQLAPAVLLVEVLCIGGVLFSLLMLHRTARQATTPRQRNVSIVVDSVLVLGFLASFVLLPPPEYWGLTRVAGLGTAYIALIGAGTRLSRRGAQLAFAIFSIGVPALVVLDEVRNPSIVHNGAANVMSVVLILGASGMFAIFTATKTRRLVLESARQTWNFERARQRLGAYVSEEVAAVSLASDEVKLGGARQEVSVLFADLRGFTSQAEGKDPVEVVGELNEYLEAMVAALGKHGGVVDKYVGDAIMAVFGAPVPRPDDAARALRAAEAMEQALAALNRRRAVRGQPPLAHGIGLHRGVVVAGHVGTPERAQYTVIGDAVNVAARLEGKTKELGVSVVVSDELLAAAAGYAIPEVRVVGDVALRGHKASIRVHTLA